MLQRYIAVLINETFHCNRRRRHGPHLNDKRDAGTDARSVPPSGDNIGIDVLFFFENALKRLTSAQQNAEHGNRW
jgi:hypothetical protein